jgi:short-subunit dehydrogenase
MNKRIVLCGASRGIGLALAEILAENPYHHLILLSRNIDGLREKFSQYKNVMIVPFDLEQDSSAQLSPYMKDIGPIHALINNSGHLEKGDFSHLPLEAYRKCMQVNFFGPVALMQYVYPNLVEGKAHIVNISTMGAHQGSVKFPGLSAYAASKAALTNFTEVFAEEHKDTGMRCNCLCLGAVDTEMLRSAFPGYVASTSANDMAQFIAHFALDSGLLLNGKIIPVSSSTP